MHKSSDILYFFKRAKVNFAALKFIVSRAFCKISTILFSKEAPIYFGTTLTAYPPERFLLLCGVALTRNEYAQVLVFKRRPYTFFTLFIAETAKHFVKSLYAALTEPRRSAFWKWRNIFNNISNLLNV